MNFSQFYRLQWLITFFSFSVLLSSCSTSPNKHSHLQLIDFDDLNVLEVTELYVDVFVDGKSAITRASYEILNKHPRRELEALFRLSLPPSARVIGYGLDINGEMVDGVIVPKEKARHAFNQIVDARIDPGVAEVNKSNVFQTEIYPVLSNKTRKIYVEYVETLEKNTKGEAMYSFPFSEYHKDTRIHFNVDANGATELPYLSSSPIHEKTFKFQPTALSRYQLTSGHRPPLNKYRYNDLAFTIKPNTTKSVKVSKSNNGKLYFSISLPAPTNIPDGKDVEDIAVFWDLSTSAETTHQQSIEALLQLLPHISNSLKSIKIIPFSHEIHPSLTLNVDKDYLAKIQSWATTLQYDGATNIRLLKEKLASNQTDKILVFTDGLNTLGEVPVDIQSPPTYVISAGQALNQPIVKMLTKQKGMHIDLSQIDIQEAIKQIRSQSPNITMSPSRPEAIRHLSYEYKPTSKTLQVYGELINTNSELTINIDNRNMRNIQFSEQKITSNELIKYQWANQYLDTLLSNANQNRSAITALGMTHHILTPFTSLIVLEDLNDYARYDIFPPKTFTQKQGFKAEWDRLRHQYSRTNAEQQHMEELLHAWQNRVDWWKGQKTTTIKEAKNALDKKSQQDEDLVNTGMRTSERVWELTQDELYALIKEGMANFRDLPSLEGLMRLSQKGLKHKAHPQTSISLKKWTSDAPYLQVLASSHDDQQEANYFELKKVYRHKPVFYIDSAMFFFHQNKPRLAKRILSNVLELDLDIADIDRMTAYTYISMKLYEEAIEILKELEFSHPHELTTYRDLALVWQKKAEANKDALALEQALNYYVQAIKLAHDDTIDSSVTVLQEFNSFLNKSKAANILIPAIDLPPKFISPLDLDLRVAMSWNNRQTDIDLWVIEPTGETVNYTNKISVTGALLPFDDTNNYGPEEYLNRFALPGEYIIKAKFFSNSSVELLGPTSVTLDIQSNFGRPNEQTKTSTIQLLGEQNVVEVGRFIVEPKEVRPIQ